MITFIILLGLFDNGFVQFTKPQEDPFYNFKAEEIDWLHEDENEYDKFGDQIAWELMDSFT